MAKHFINILVICNSDIKGTGGCCISVMGTHFINARLKLGVRTSFLQGEYAAGEWYP